MRIAICDDLYCDKAVLRRLIDKYCADYCLETEIFEFDSGEDFLADFIVGKFQVVFLDIYMDGIDGITVAQKIREMDSDCIIIFTTTSFDYAVTGFAVKALHYLVKPVAYEQIVDTFSRCQKTLAHTMQYIEVLSNKIKIKILLKDIIYVEVYDKTSLIHTKSNIVKTYLPINKIEGQLRNKSFLRCHRSYLVNMRYVDNILKDDFLLKNGEKIPIRKADKLFIKQTYADYLFALTREGNDV